MSPEAFARTVQVHVAAPFWLTQAAWPLMKRQGYGRVIFTTSGRALLQESAQPGLSAYAIGKTAPLGLMIALAAEGAPSGIRVNAISPVAATRMLQREVPADALRPEQVAPAVVYLASDRCEASGTVLRARDGMFAAGGWRFGDGVTLGPEALTPEGIAEHWHAITG